MGWRTTLVIMCGSRLRWNMVFRASKQGKIKRAGRGVYVGA